ncbi:histidine kinase dimerization/phospho-acceptor domain-containing protein [Alteromonas sp. 1_MG-2023]|uniref:histidine kinase dimerization/phospho-acceptor domain-containing protein n=1 Tax=Alteromonas sp. 1_MG-2023 TaxID=3062669 RepID=UPI0026E2626F|nr:histidine kinase dimerization/phospho-acceptor domain-containing protein [Alteromonas sp. 1_MG-2023]MDO6565781.1 histidine kinase dimerization/phospho-acceptor domain-containing protein [Alteromonas sp. 1_MG-2023]
MVKGLHLSLRRYVLWTLLAVGSVLITLFSIFSADRFFEGMDGMMRVTMTRVAANSDISEDSPESVLNFYISATFEQQPEEIKKAFLGKKLVPYELQKNLERDWFFTRPNAARFLVMVPLENGQVRYVSQVFGAPKGERHRPIWLSHELVSIIIGLTALGVFAVILLLIMRSVTKPVEMLQQWAAGLDEKQLDAPIPRFRYQELNVLASLIHNSLQSVKQTLERERTFVNHASHELRTPIAVIRSSTELLQRVLIKEQQQEQQQLEKAPSGMKSSIGTNALVRIDNASKTMTDLTETLLWLARDNDQTLPYHNVEVSKMVGQLCDDLGYLLRGKSVQVELHIPKTEMYLPETACRIIIGNVIRNAFQHTDCGLVKIELDGNTLTVENHEVLSRFSEEGKKTAGEGDYAPSLDDTGYGLGLKLISKLTDKLKWEFEAGAVTNGYHVRLELHEPANLAN